MLIVYVESMGNCELSFWEAAVLFVYRSQVYFSSLVVGIEFKASLWFVYIPYTTSPHPRKLYFGEPALETRDVDLELGIETSGSLMV